MLNLPQFHQTFSAKQKVAGAQRLAKNSHAISPTIKTPNYELKLAQFLPNLFANYQTPCT